jgi:hypothetical protein
MKAAGFQVGSLGYVKGAGHSNWTSIAVVLGSPESAISYIDSQHDLFAGEGYYSVSNDGSSPHAFKLIQRDSKNRLEAVAIFAMRGDLVVMLQAANGTELSAAQVQIVMRLLLARSADDGPPASTSTGAQTIRA